MPELPRISIVTPSYNQVHFLEETISSVLSQDYPDLEYIIIDGSSTDDSVEIIRKYDPWLAYWVSEPDRGQSHALNKGFARATGEIMNWLNSDDLYVPGALRAVGEMYQKHPDHIIAGDVVSFEERTGREYPHRAFCITFENMVRFWEQKHHWHQPGVYFPRSAYALRGPLDETLHFGMDHDLMCRMLQDCPVAYVNQVLVRFRLHPESKNCSAPDDWFTTEISRISQRYWDVLGSVDPVAHDRWVTRRLLLAAGTRLLQGRLGDVVVLVRDSLRVSVRESLSSVVRLALDGLRKVYRCMP